MTKPTKTSSKGGCGCGGGGKTSTAPSPCGCGGGKHECKCGGQTACQDSCSGQEFRRPVFFEGQMLTEDDLQALSGYVVQKNRLHMRHFWGDGVVCGLHVKPHPCSHTKLIVEPGYALDCCGNDIVLQCPQELDIRQMVRDLQVAMQEGYDCGDPCPEEKPCGPAAKQPPPQDTSTPLTFSEAAVPVSAAPVPAVATTPPPPPRREYCLYVNYCEKGVDPTTAYGTGQQCGTPACYPTRILEGLLFELRCRPKETAPDNFSTRYCQCRQKQLKDAKDAARIDSIDRLRNTYSQAIANDQAGDFAFSKAEYVTATKTTASLAQTPIEDDASLDAAFDAASAMLKHSARYYALPPDQRKGLNVSTAQLAAGSAALSKLVEAFGQPRAKALLEARPAVERDYDAALAGRVAEIAKFTEESVLPENEKPLLQGVVITDALVKGFTNELDVVGARLGPDIAALAPTSATLRSTAAPLMAVRTISTLPNVNQLQLAVDRAGVMVSNVQNAKIDCICDNLIPPCLPCTDQGVLLACFAWDQCEITHLCELVRKFVLTPNNLRYWIPFIGEIGDLVEELCCCRENWREILAGHGGSPLAIEVLLGGLNANCETRTAAPSMTTTSSFASRVPRDSLYFAARDLLPRSSFAPATEPAPETTIVLRALDQLLEDEAFRKSLRERLKT